MGDDETQQGGELATIYNSMEKMADIKNQVAIILKSNKSFLIQVKDVTEGLKVINLLYDSKGKTLVKTSMEPCPVIVNCDEIARAVYTSVNPTRIHMFLKDTITEQGDSDEVAKG